MPSFMIYKPFKMLSQFSREMPQHITLADLDYTFNKNVYPVGRLDADSEGLLILSDDKKLNHQILNPKSKQAKTYYVQVEGTPTEDDLESLRKGVSIKLKKGYYTTLPAKTILLESSPTVPIRNPPIRFRKNVSDSWLSIEISEGKNRQVRKMCAAIGFPVLRLIRVGIAGYSLFEQPLKGMASGDVIKI